MDGAVPSWIPDSLVELGLTGVLMLIVMYFAWRMLSGKLHTDKSVDKTLAKQQDGHDKLIEFYKSQNDDLRKINDRLSDALDGSVANQQQLLAQNQQLIRVSESTVNTLALYREVVDRTGGPRPIGAGPSPEGAGGALAGTSGISA